jgi:NHS family xanthosine MFS transporter
MGLKLRLTVMQFLEFFIWGSWLISFGGYLTYGLAEPASGTQIGTIFAMAGVASLIAPGIIGIIADKWLNSERLLGICHLIGAIVLFFASKASTYEQLFPLMLINAIVFMPTISLSYSVCYSLLDKSGLEPVKTFPPIRVWGTVGFIVAMFVVDLMNWKISSNQLLLASVSALVLAVYSFTLPPSPPVKTQKKTTWKSAFGLDALVLFKEKQMAIFFIFAVLLGVCLQITNSFGSSFILGFGNENVYGDLYKHTFAIQHSNIFLSISQIAEALFILAIPFFMRKFGIKTVMLMSLGAWILRFGLFGVGNPGTGVVWLILSMIIYGMAFDFFNISASLYIEKETPENIRSSSQGLLMMATNGLGAVLGNVGAGLVVEYFTNSEGITNWSYSWFAFASYALVIGILFALFFQYKHRPEK